MKNKNQVNESIEELIPLSELVVTGAIVVRGKTIPVARFLNGNHLPEGIEIVYARLSPFQLRIEEVRG
jgi:hypothetical protein